MDTFKYIQKGINNGVDLIEHDRLDYCIDTWFDYIDCSLSSHKNKTFQLEFIKLRYSSDISTNKQRLIVCIKFLVGILHLI